MQYGTRLPFNASGVIRTNRLLPVQQQTTHYPLCCSNCNYVNAAANNYCTNCGFPIRQNTDHIALYKYRLHQRRQMLQRCENGMAYARNALYVLAGLCSLGVVYVASSSQYNMLRGVVMLVMAGLYVYLARWSLKSPFTAFLISFLIFLTFILVNTLSDVEDVFNTVSGVYGIFFQLAFVYIIAGGLKAAHQAEAINEEFKL